MKRKFYMIGLLVSFILVSMKAQASSLEQNSSQDLLHQDFCGIQMGGEYNLFRDALIRDGYVTGYCTREPDRYTYVGANDYKGCDIVVDVTPDSRLVYRVSVIYRNLDRDHYQAKTIRNEFNRIAERMIAKNGKPDMDLRKGKADWFCTWYKGGVMKNYSSLQITSRSGMQVSMEYVDGSTAPYESE